jgi:hypothetical protein
MLYAYLLSKEVLVMKRLLLLTLVCTALLSVTPVWGAGEYYVIAGGGGAGTKISSLPYPISQSGFYYLGQDLSGDAGITVNADNVTIDLMGFSLIGNNVMYSAGIEVHATNVEIRNGTVRNFYWGIDSQKIDAIQRVINVRAVNNWVGINLILGNGQNGLVQGCAAVGNGAFGIYVQSGKIIGNVCTNSNWGIILAGPGSVIGNKANQNTTYNFYFASQVDDVVLVNQNSASGLGIFMPNYATYLLTPKNITWGVNAGRP